MKHAWLLVALSLGGCALRLHGGYVESLADEGAEGAVMMSGHADFLVWDSPYLMTGPSIRGKAGPNTFSAATGVEVGIPPQPERNGPVAPSVYVGAHVLQLDRTRQQTAFGMGSPYLQAGANFCRWDKRRGPDDILCGAFAVEVEHFVRFGHPNETFIGLSFGLTQRIGSF